MQVLKEEIRQAILRTAERFFLDKGYDQTSMKEVAKQIGISVGNVYRYFPNKEALFQAIISPALMGMEQLVARHENPEPEEGFRPEMIGQISVVLSALLLEHRQSMLILYYKSEGTPFASFKESLIKQFGEHVLSHLEGNSMDKRVAEPIAIAFLDGFFAIIRLHEDEKTVERLTEQYLEVWFKGLQQLM